MLAIHSLVKQSFYRLPDNLRASLVLLLAAFGFSLMVTLIKLVGQRLPVSQILFVRQLGMFIILLPLLARNFPGVLASRQPVLQLARIGCALVAMLCGFTAVVELPLADAVAIGFAKSFFVTIFAVLWLGERVGLPRWSAITIGFVGVLIMMRPGASGFSVYGLQALVGAAAAGAVMVIIRLLSRTEQGATILAWQAIGVGMLISVPAIIQWVAPTPMEWLLLAGIGVVSYFSQKANIYAFSHGEASLLASLDYTRLLYATLLGWMLFGELPDAATWAGAGIIIAASVYTVHREARRQQMLARGPNARGLGTS